MFKINIKSKKFTTPDHTQNHVLKDIEFSIEENDFLSIIGPSGCGKTTILRILAGFDNDFDGSIMFSPKSGSGSDYEIFDRLGKIGYIPQEFSLFPWLTIEKNIRFGLNIKNIPKKEQDETVDRLLDLVDMNEYRKYLPNEISGGMKQKIAICRALAINPTSRLIVMDEPFSALDAQTRNSLQQDLLEIWRNQKLTIVFVTHNIDEATFLSKRIIVLGKNPATVIQEVRIDIPHIRDRTSVEFNQIRKDLLNYLN
ncbi:MAG: ABC transporter ATP-binding protein [Promethearchaeota archaeon]